MRISSWSLDCRGDPPPAKVKAFAQAMKINYPVAMSQPSLEAKFGGVFDLPTSFVLDTRDASCKSIGLRTADLRDGDSRC
jgi:hypothetical protein